MKKLTHIKIFILTILMIACNEDEWLKEEPLDFYSPENSYVTEEQFNSAAARIYEVVNQAMIETAQLGHFVYHYTTDIAYDAIAPTHGLNSYIDKITPETGEVTQMWQFFYRIIFDANTILGRIEDEGVQFSSLEKKNQIIGEAQFFRGFAYRNLGIQWGGVPIILEELSRPKRDFTRASREEVYAQSISDLESAVQNLPHVSDLEEEGRLTKAAANHLLAELYIITGEYDKAVDASTAVIDDPDYALMTERFGKDQDKPGDVYWDLFRRGNQNRNGGMNTEAIWVSQYEYLIEGGGQGNSLTRFLIPQYWRASGTDGVNLFFGHSSKYGGRGIGWMVASDYLINQVWNDPGDMRNSEHNIIRDIVADNPQSQFFGQKIIESGAFDRTNDPFSRNWSVIFAKSAPLNDFPAEVIDDPTTGATNNGARYTFRDHYFMRLAETYLLRAEAYLAKGDLENAAQDINTVRERAGAAPVAPVDVDIDFILDERARELYFEEYRLLTLMRLGKLVERVEKYNPMYTGEIANNGIESFHELWPIPQSEIERNTEAVLEQNPGYTGG